MKYLEDKRKRLQGQQTAPVQKQPIQYTPKTAPAVQTQAAAPATAEKQTYTAPKAPADKQTTTPAPTSTPTAPVQTAGSDVVAQAQEYLNQQLGGYNSRYGSQINDLVAQIQNRPAFEYDVNTDPLYLQLRDIWKQDGLMAMEDTMGQAAQLTGGYGNSHAQMAGQQVYNGYLRQVNEMVPELKEAARADYDAENADLLQKLGLLMDQEEQDYGRWMDELERQRYDEENAYSKGQNAYDRLVELIASTGYTPTAEELAAAGMTEQQAKAWRGYWQGNQAAGGSGSGGGSRKSGSSGSGSGPTASVIDQYHILAGNGVSKDELLASANEDRADGTITEQEYAQLVAWIKTLDDNPNEPVKSGYTGSGSRDLGMPLHTRN